MLTILLALTASAELPPDAVFPGPHAAQVAQYGHLDPVNPPVRVPRGAATPGPHMTVYGYLAYWDDNLNTVPWDELSHLAIFQADVGTDGSLSNTGRWSETSTAIAMGAPYGVRVHLCVTNFVGSELTAILSSSTARATLVSNLKTWVDNTGAHGVNIDFEGLPASERANMVTFVGELEAAGVGDIVLATPAVDWSDAWDYAALTEKADLFIMGYGYHYSGSSNAGPNDPLYGGGLWASWQGLDWSARDYVDTNGADPSRVILGLPLYGIEWPVGDNTVVPTAASGRGSSIFYAEANSAAATYGRQWESGALSPWYGRPGYQAWYSDVESIRHRVQYAANTGLGGIGFWALNYDNDDAALWAMIREETTDEGVVDTGPTDTGPTDTGPFDSDEPVANEFVANAGLPFLAYTGDAVMLDGTRSRGPGTLQFQWEQIAGPEVFLANDTTANPTFRVRESGTHIFALTVGDGQNWSEADTSHVVVLDPEMGGRGCGCAHGGLGWSWMGLLPLLAVRRRR